MSDPALRTDTRLAKIALRLWPYLPGSLGLRLFRWAIYRAAVTAQYPDRPPIALGRIEDHVDPAPKPKP